MERGRQVVNSEKMNLEAKLKVSAPEMLERMHTQLLQRGRSKLNQTDVVDPLAARVQRAKLSNEG